LVFSDGDDCDRARDRIKDNHAAIAGDPFGAEEARTDLLLGTEDLSEKKSSRQSMYFFFFGFRRRFGGGWPSCLSSDGLCKNNWFVDVKVMMFSGRVQASFKRIA